MNPIEEINRAAERIEHLMKENAVNKLAIERKYLPEIFDADLLELSKDGFPTLSSFVLEEFKLRGIFTKLYGNVVNFYYFPIEKIEDYIKEFLQQETVHQPFPTRKVVKPLYGYVPKKKKKDEDEDKPHLLKPSDLFKK